MPRQPTRLAEDVFNGFCRISNSNYSSFVGSVYRVSSRWRGTYLCWFYEFELQLKTQSKVWKLTGEPRTKRWIIKVQCEDNVNCFLQFLWYFLPRICPFRSGSERQFLRWNFQSSTGTSSTGFGTRGQVDPSSRQTALVREFLVRSSVTVTDYSPYSPI